MKRIVFSNGVIVAAVCIILLMSVCTGYAFASGGNSGDPSSQLEEIEGYINKQMREGRIPGISVVVVKDNKTILKKGYGYADKQNKVKVSPDTLFELGSTSKAFTAIGVLQLVENGLIRLEDPVTKYLPWFEASYSGEYKGHQISEKVPITLEQLLHHTSGIPFKTIGDIPIDSTSMALENTVKNVSGVHLDFYPGERFLYATINYDILGLIIEKCTGQSFEDYLQNEVMLKLGMNQTYLGRNKSDSGRIAEGYKLKFLRAAAYQAPEYRGNTPAGYIISNASDTERWLQIQLGKAELPSSLAKLISASHEPDRSVMPGPNGSSYAAGWNVFQKGGGELSHAGSNPNYSSFFSIRPSDGVGVAVLANLNSSYTELIGQGITEILQGYEPSNAITGDTYKSADTISFVIFCVAVPASLAIMFFLIMSLIQIHRQGWRAKGNFIQSFLKVLFALIVLLSVGFSLYKMPALLFWGLPWSFVNVWAPNSVIYAVALLYVTVGLFVVYSLISSIFEAKEKRQGLIFSLISLSLLSGFGNALIIFVINEALNRNGDTDTALVMYFVLGILIYVFGQRIVRSKFIHITNNLVYEKRSELITKILGSDYEQFEKIDNGKLYAGLNNDTENISNFVNIFVSLITNIVTLLCCFIYLGVINFYGLLSSIIFIAIAAGLYFATGKSANKLWEETRDSQNLFFGFIRDMVDGFKELNLNRRKRSEFHEDMMECCDNYKRKQIAGNLKFTNVFVIGELLFTFVIGVVVFLFPVIFDNVQNNSLRSYVLVFLYMTGPVNGVLNAIPNLFQIRISWNRLNQLIDLLGNGTVDSIEPAPATPDRERKRIDLQLKEVAFRYNTESGHEFLLGPLSCSFKSGEVTFITGGNGSGKSTLAKIITGLYSQHSGSISLNGEESGSEQLKGLYTTVFNDYYLFKKLYGMNEDNRLKDALVDDLLAELQVADKVRIENGEFSTVDLSTGQRKRLALFVSYIEDKPIFLFDEWASDQDPEFRSYFYSHLLFQLKEKSKCVIVITHDDQYFHLADQIIKMDLGKIVPQSQYIASALIFAAKDELVQ
ncbi:MULTISPECIES: cyclic peptide export ABC transporter [unclassified Paenibacillus]|uniref:cyclic peptide export ABC transporter n=1 Tax=unclassified Paenibacillus TaxID=185978 RepID=UPI0030FA28B3